MQNKKVKRIGAALASAIFVTLYSEPIKAGQQFDLGNDYKIFFVDEKDRETYIMNPQSGCVPEETCLNITFPEKMVGKDGYLWKALEESPKKINIVGTGVQKYYIEYQREERKEGQEQEALESSSLKKWLKAAEQAEWKISGNEIHNRYVVIENAEQNNSYIKNLISMINDGDWHHFYLIGKEYIPQTAVIGSSFDAEYSAVVMDKFSIEGMDYTVIRAGVKRNWKMEHCIHSWKEEIKTASTCVKSGFLSYQCSKCDVKKTVMLPVSGHLDQNQDSLCDYCNKRFFAQKRGDSIHTVLLVKENKELKTIPISFICLDENYRGTGKMLYLSEQILGSDITGTCFKEGETYQNSDIRHYLRFGFSNDVEIASALQEIKNAELNDFSTLLSKEEYENYQKQGLISLTEQGYFLRDECTSEDEKKEEKIWAVQKDGTITTVNLKEDSDFGVRPLILLDAPKQEMDVETRYWKKGELQARKIGEQIYLFQCVDEDYRNEQFAHKKAALFLCDSVIRSDIERDSFQLKKISFGEDNNYKVSDVRKWLNQNAEYKFSDLETVPIGISSAYLGSTKEGTWDQLDESQLFQYDIGFQLMKDTMFCLSLEEALKYRDVLWKFEDSEENNPETQLSPHSEGYYLRTPVYRTDESGNFQYTDQIYAIDLKHGTIHPVNTNDTAFGIRPAFVLLQQ